MIGTGGTRRSAAVGSLDGMSANVLFAADATPVFTALGRAAFPRGRAIFAQRVDPRALTPMGEPVVLGSGVSPYGGLDFHGDAGTLTYHSDVRSTTLAWFDRGGRRLAVVASGVRLKHPALAPGGAIIAVERADDSGQDDIWMYDERGAARPLTSGPGRVSDPTWSPDGKRLVFSQDDGQALYELDLSSGAERPLLAIGTERDAAYATDWSPDGGHILYAGYGGETFADIWMLSRLDPAKPLPLVRTVANEHQARFSPDGRFMAYASDASGRPEVYIKAVPPAQGEWPISTGGGAQPMWRHDGRELFYLDLEGTLLSVAVETGSLVTVGDTTSLFKLSLTDSPFFGVRNDYAVSPDGQRFLVANVDPSDRARLNVVVDWEAALDR